MALQSNNFGSAEVRRIEKDLRIANKEEKAYWRVESRVQWLNEGDKNTNFFHAQTMKRWRFNQIRGLEEENGIWHESEVGICSIAVSYFSELFQSCYLRQVDEIIGWVDSRVTHDDNKA